MCLSMNQKVGEGKLHATVSEEGEKWWCYCKEADLIGRAHWLDSNTPVPRTGLPTLPVGIISSILF